MRLQLLVPVLALLPLAACATTPGGAAAPLEGRDWRLVEVAGRPVAAADTARAAYLRFDADSGRVTGSTGCNRLTGPFTRDGDRLTFGPAVTTRMACLEESRMAVERDLLGALQATRRHAVAGDTLALLGDDAAAAPLARLVAGR